MEGKLDRVSVPAVTALAALAALVLVEKLAPYGDAVARAAGVVLVALAVTEGVSGWPGV